MERVPHKSVDVARNPGNGRVLDLAFRGNVPVDKLKLLTNKATKARGYYLLLRWLVPFQQGIPLELEKGMTIEKVYDS